jgi:cobalt-zinc-cadmium efflux system outer membrane protein
VDYSVGVQQEVDLAGKRGAELRAARSELSARHAELLATRWLVHQEVHALYHQAVVARESAQAARRVLTFAERLANVARQRFAAGETSQLPVRLAEAELAQAMQATLLADSEYSRIRLDLARAAGWTKPALLTPTGKLGAPTMPPSAESLMHRARREQPALRAARARHAAAQARLGAAKRRAWPNPTLGVLFENEAQLGAAPQRIISGTLSLPIPVWVGSAPDRARARAGIAEAEAQQTALTTTLGARIVQARQRVEANAKRALVYGTEILPTLETNLDLLQKAFELGEIDVLQVMVAQERFLRTQQDALAAFAEYYRAWAELEAAVGSELHGSGVTTPTARAQETSR